MKLFNCIPVFFLWGMLFLSGAMPGMAQTAVENVRKVCMVFSASKQLYYEAHLTWYADGGPAVTDTLTVVFHRNGEQEYARYGSAEVLKTAGLTVAVDHEKRIISVLHEDTENVLPLAEMLDPMALQQAVQYREYDVKETTEGALRMATITDPDDPDSKTILKYTPESWQLREAWLGMRDPFHDEPDTPAPWVTIGVRYRQLQTTPRPFPYQIARFVTAQADGYMGTGRYKGYEVMTND